MQLKMCVKRLLCTLVLLCVVCPLFAQRKITIKLASLVPENTPWGAAINRMATDWAQATHGEVELRVFHNGVAGDEEEVLRKLRVNQIQAAVFTSFGLNSVTSEVMTVSYPFLIRNNRELDAVLKEIKPELDVKMQQNGFVTLALARAGWVKFFSRTPMHTPRELQNLKLGSNPDEEKMIDAFKTMGYQVVPLNLNDTLIALNSGRVDVVYQSPVYVAGNQTFGVAKNMLDINIAPFMGGLVINQTTWKKIPDKYKPELLAICKRVEVNIEGSFAKLEEDAIAAMTKYGLAINRPNSQQVQEWYDSVTPFENRLAGPVFNRDLYFRIKRILEGLRGGR